VDKWRPLPDNLRCLQCDNPACFAQEAFDDRVRCEYHRLANDVDCRLEAEDDARPSVLRMKDDERVSCTVATRAWRPMMANNRVVSIRTWMHMNVNQLTQPALWNKFLTSYGPGTATCSSYMSTADHPMFPQFHPDRRMFSFQNGVYDVSTNRFYRYAVDPVPEVCCVNHLDTYFDPAWTTTPPEDLAVPGYDDILASQNYDRGMVCWLDVFLGRMLFNVGEMDTWEKLLVIKGWAATGKSTIAKALLTCLGASNVGNIPANCEEQWALASVYDKLIWMCTELKKDWRFPTAVLQSMISGEVVPIHVKNKTAVDIVWKIPGMAVGNEEPTTWVNDPMNALFRRVIPWPFDVTPKQQDPTVQRKFMNSLGPFLVRISRNYLLKVFLLQDRNVDSELPPRLKEARSKFLRNTQPLVRFLEESADVELAKPDLLALLKRQAPAAASPSAASVASVATAASPTQILTLRSEWRMRMSDLNLRFKEWWNQNNLGKSTPSITSKAVYDVAITHLGVSVERDEADRCDFMYGVRSFSSVSNNGYQAVVYGGAS